MKYLLSVRLFIWTALISIFGSAASFGADKLLSDVAAILDEDPDHPTYIAMLIAPGKEKLVADKFHLSKWQGYSPIHVIFTQAKASDVLVWQNQPDIELIDVVDDSQAFAVERMLRELSKVALYDNIGVYRLGVLNISIGPPRAFVNRGMSGERAIGHVLSDIVSVHGIPVVISIGNDGPAAGFVNPWARAAGVFVIAGTDKGGRFVWDQSSRFTAPLPSDAIVFAAQAIDVIGARAHCKPKTADELAADQRVGLAGVVGADKVACFGVDSGTSFAAANVTHMMCLLHQGVSLLSLEASSFGPLNMSWPLDPFIRGYIDSGVDLTLPPLQNSGADEPRHHGPLFVDLKAEQKQLLYYQLSMRGVDVRLRWSPKSARALLRLAARPVPGAAAEEAGAGFLSWDNIVAMLKGLTLSQLIELFSDSPLQQQWIESLGTASNSLVFRATDIDLISQYCESHDVGLEFPIYSDQKQN